MKHSLFFWSIILLLLASTAAVSALVFYSVMPNTDDDALSEYIEIYNSSCEPVSLSGVSLRDLSGKVYTFTGGVLESA